jgi:hypothetical protein
MIFVSPGGKGLKIFVRIQNPAAENHLHYWQAGVKYFKHRYNLDVDPSCKDIGRACYLCHDPEALFCEYGCVNAHDLLNKFPPEDSSTVPLRDNSQNENSSPIEIEQLKELEKLYRNFKFKSLGKPDSHLDKGQEVNLFNTSSAVCSYARALLCQHGYRQNGIKFLRPGSTGNPKKDHSAVFAVPPGYTIPVFYNFSSGDSIFQSNKGYSPVQVISLLEFNGDFAECIKSLKLQFSWLLPKNQHLKKNSNENLESPHQHIGTSAHQHIDTSPHQHIDPSAHQHIDYFNPRDLRQMLEDGKRADKRKKIIGPFLYQNTTTLLFSRTNYGKSVLAFQFAYCAATGTSFEEKSILINECDPMKVMIIDLELDEIEYYSRHGSMLDDLNPIANENILFMHEKLEKDTVIGFDLLKKIEYAAVFHKAQLLVIDNISKLLPDAVRPEAATMVIHALNRIRYLTGASILVIGHTTKGNPNICIQPTDYYGSAMIQNFFNELCYLDKTKDGNFMLIHSKTKRPECYDTTVPVLIRGEHHRFGFGFTYAHLANAADLRLPFSLDQQSHRPRNLSDFKKEIITLHDNGFKNTEIAKVFSVSSTAIAKILHDT